MGRSRGRCFLSLRWSSCGAPSFTSQRPSHQGLRVALLMAWSLPPPIPSPSGSLAASLSMGRASCLPLPQENGGPVATPTPTQPTVSVHVAHAALPGSVPALPPHGGSVGTASPSPSQAASPACTCRAHTRAQITSPCEHRSAGCPGQSRAFPTAPPLSHPAPACRSLARDSEAGPNPGS